MPSTWRDFPRPDDALYYEERFPYLSQGDILIDVPMLVPTAPLLVDESEDYGVLASIPFLKTAAMIVTPTCDVRRRSAYELAEAPEQNPYGLRQQVVVARILALDEWERSQRPEGCSDRVMQLRSHDNQRQYMYLPGVGSLPESLVDLGTVWTLPLDIALSCVRLTQLAESSARQLQYKLVMYGTANVIDRESLRPPMD